MAYRIKNWHEFQHFKSGSRDMVWVKVYRKLLDDPDWHSLKGDVAKGLVMLWLLASESDGYLPDIRKISFRLRMTETQIKELISQLDHWLVQDDINGISDEYQNDALEKEKEKEKERVIRLSRKTQLPKDFSISERVKQWALEKGHHSLQAHFENFVGAARAKGYTYVDWDEALMKAIRDNWAKVPAKQQRQVAM